MKNHTLAHPQHPFMGLAISLALLSPALHADVLEVHQDNTQAHQMLRIQGNNFKPSSQVFVNNLKLIINNATRTTKRLEASCPPLVNNTPPCATNGTFIKGGYRLAVTVGNFTSGQSLFDITLSNPATHTLGEAYGGGTVFYVTPNGSHGLVAATQDQGRVSWYDAQDAISTASNHNAAGGAFTDWRLPTKNELNLLHSQRSVVGNFTNNGYWSSTEASTDTTKSWGQSFGIELQAIDLKINQNNVRAVRAF